MSSILNGIRVNVLTESENKLAQLEMALSQARQATKNIKYDNTVNDIIAEIQGLAQKYGMDAKTVKWAVSDVIEAKNNLESAVYGLEEVFKDAWENEKWDQEDKEGLAEGHADQVKKVFKKNGKPVGEVGIDPEASPGNGQWYMKCYAYDIDNAGYDSYEEAVEELKYCLKQGVAEGVRDLGYDAQSLIMKLRRDVEEKRLQPTPQAVLAAARELAGDMDFAPQLLVKQVLGQGVTEAPTRVPAVPSKILSATDDGKIITIKVRAPDGSTRSMSNSNPSILQKWLNLKFGLRLPHEISSKFVFEFAPPGGDDREPDEEAILKKLASMWWNGSEGEMSKAEKTLASMGWEIGLDESGDDDAGVFVIRAGDVNGDTYMAFPDSELKLDEAHTNYHANRTGFSRGPRDDERHDLDVAKQQWALKINGKVWSKDGKAVTFDSKEKALKARQSLLAKKPDLEVGLVTRQLEGYSAGAQGGAGLGIEKSPIEKIIERPFGVDEHINSPGGMGQAYRKFKPKSAGVAEGAEKRCMQCGMPNCSCTPGKCKCKPIDGWIPGKGFKKDVVAEEQAPMFTPEENLSELKQDTIDDYISRKSALARGGLPEPSKKFGNVKAPAWKVAAGKIAKPGSEMEKYAKVKATLEDEAKIVNANDPRSDGWRIYKAKPAGTSESSIMKGLQNEAGGVTRWSKENPPPPELLLNTLVQILMKPENQKSPQDLISLWNDKYGLKHTLGSLRQYAQNDYKKMELSKALQKAALANESSEGK